jgi:hypothetical protein
MSRGDVEERYLLRLGGGERDLQINPRFHKAGSRSLRFAKRGQLLEQIQLLSECWASVVRLNESGWCSVLLLRLTAE